MSTYLIWFLIGLIFLIAEFLLPTFILFFFGLGAIIISIITSFYDLSINSQIGLFGFLSLLSLLLFRNYMKNIFLGDELSDKDDYFEKSINSDGGIAEVSKAINPSKYGEIKFKGTFYKAKADNTISVGTSVKVINKGDEQGSFYLVKEINDWLEK